MKEARDLDRLPPSQAMEGESSGDMKEARDLDRLPPSQAMEGESSGDMKDVRDLDRLPPSQAMEGKSSGDMKENPSPYGNMFEMIEELGGSMKDFQVVDHGDTYDSVSTGILFNRDEFLWVAANNISSPAMAENKFRIVLTTAPFVLTINKNEIATLPQTELGDKVLKETHDKLRADLDKAGYTPEDYEFLFTAADSENEEELEANDTNQDQEPLKCQEACDLARLSLSQAMEGKSSGGMKQTRGWYNKMNDMVKEYGGCIEDYEVVDHGDSNDTVLIGILLDRDGFVWVAGKNVSSPGIIEKKGMIVLTTPPFVLNYNRKEVATMPHSEFKAKMSKEMYNQFRADLNKAGYKPEDYEFLFTGKSRSMGANDTDQDQELLKCQGT